MTLTEFLTARLDEDDAKARRVSEGTSGGTLQVWLQFKDGPGKRSEELVDAYDPARVLAEVDAKRRIVEWCNKRDLIDIRTVGSPDPPRPEDFVPGGRTHAVDSVVLRWLALPYADHPDYDESWRP